VYKSSETTYFH